MAPTEPTTANRAGQLKMLLELAHEDGVWGLTLDSGMEDSEEARESVALANACLTAEHDLRQRQWRALERLLSLVPPCGGELKDVVHLPGASGLRALKSALALGWLEAAPQDDGDEAGAEN